MRFLVFTAILVLAAFSASGQGAGSVAVIGSVAELTNRPPSTLNPVVMVSGYRTNGDWGPARTIRYEPGNTNSIDSGCNFVTKNASGRWHAMDCDGNQISVAFYGAIGGDGLDDTAAIQAAIDSLPLPATNSLFVERGGTVFIPAGTYKITGPLRMRPGRIEGSSRFGTVLVNHGLTNDVISCMTPSNTPPTGIWLYRVAHMSIHQADATIPTAGAAIRVQSDDGVTASMADVEDVFVHGTFRGFHGSALQGVNLKGNTMYATKDDGYLWDVYQTMVHVSGCWAYYCGQNGTGHGWHLQGPAYCTVVASGADSNYGWGWYIEPGSMQNPVGGTYAVGGEQNAKGGMFIKGARGGVYTPMLVTKAGNSPPADGIVVDSSLSVTIAGGFTQQTGSGAIGYPLRVTNSISGYPSVTLSGTYLNSYFDGTNYHQTLGEVNSFAHEERGFLGLQTDGKPRRMLDIHDRTGAAGNSTGHELARLALHTSDTNGNAFISLSPDGEDSFFKIIANNPSTNTVFNVGTNADVVFHAPGAPSSGDGGSFLFQIDDTPVMTLKGGDTLGAMGIGTTRPNPAALLDVRSSTRGILLPSWESTEFESGLYGSGQYTPPGLLAYDSDARSLRVQTRNASDGLTNNQWTSLFGYVGRDLRLGTAHRLVGTIFPQSIHATDTNIGSVYLSFTAEGIGGLEIEQNSLRAGPYQYGTFGDTILRNSYDGSGGAWGNLLLMAGDNASVKIGNGTDRGLVTVETNLFVTGAITAKESTAPVTPAAGKATIWLEEADSSKSIKVKWPDGSNTALYPQAGGGTNASTVYVSGTQVDAPNFVASAKFSPSVTGGTNVSFLPVAGSLQTNDVDATFHALLVAGGGSGDVVGPASSTDSVVALYDGTTGKLLKDGTLTEAAISANLTEAEASALYQATNSVLTTLATLNGSALTNLNASSIASGTLSSNRLPEDIALTSLSAGTLTATSVAGDGSGLTNLNGSNIASGTVADARIPTTIARTNAPTLHSPTLVAPTLGVASATSLTLGATNVVTALAEKAPLASPALTGTPTVNGTNLMAAVNSKLSTRTGVPREIWIPASAMNPGSDAPTPATNSWNTTTDGQRWEGWDFSATSTNSVYFLLALPSAWDAGTVKAKIMWKQVVAAATATNSWQIGGGSLTDGETGGNTLGTLVEVLDVGANDTNVVSVSAASGAITIGGTPSAGHLTWFTVRRHPGDDDDNFAQLSRLIGVHLQYTETATEASAW